jgi:calcium/calmodulin-dependent protein kinase I
LNFSGHESLIQLLNIFDRPPNFLCSVMEYADGGELYDLITKRVQLEEDEAKNIITQICAGVAFMHSMGSVHRDIKPENICLVGKKWKLCDCKFMYFHSCDFLLYNNCHS